MVPVVLLLLVSLLRSCESQESSPPLIPVFVKKGGDVLLELRADDVPEDFTVVRWIFKDIFLVTFKPAKAPKVYLAYNGRVETSVKSYSVNLKNLHDADSGVYSVRVETDDRGKTTHKYNITVQDPVSPVDLTVDSVSGSSDSCNLTVTCRAQDSHHIISSTFTCDNKTCSQDGGKRSEVTTSGTTLQLSLIDDSIICNHSNKVSSKNDTEEIQLHCQPKVSVSSGAIAIGSGIGVPVAVCGIGIVFAYYHLKWKKKTCKDTVYADPQNCGEGQTPTEASEYPLSSTYAMVQPHSRSVESTKSTNTPNPETLYTEVKKPRSASSNQHLEQKSIDTIYSKS